MLDDLISVLHLVPPHDSNAKDPDQMEVTPAENTDGDKTNNVSAKAGDQQVAGDEVICTQPTNSSDFPLPERNNDMDVDAKR